MGGKRGTTVYGRGGGGEGGSGSTIAWVGEAEEGVANAPILTPMLPF
jgi:hypothetical protein